MIPSSTNSCLLEPVLHTAAENLAENLKKYAFCSVVDEFMQDQLILPMALATGTSVVEYGLESFLDSNKKLVGRVLSMSNM